MIDAQLYSYMNELLDRTPTAFVRYKYDDIDWNVRLIGITGPRGVGKSVMMLQRILFAGQRSKSLYVSADSMYFANNTLWDLAGDFVKEGGEYLYIDEIHKYSGWSREIKSIYDMHPALHLVFSGSSVLDIKKGEADLSRRVLMYEMQGLSFREYLQLRHGIKSPVYTLQEILQHKVTIPGVEHPLPLFREYLANGYYPYAIEGHFNMRTEQVVAQTIETDIAQYADMKASTARKLKRMLSIISTLAPYKPSIEGLAQEVGVSKNNVPDYLVYLERAGMLALLRDDTQGMRELGKLEKVYIDNPSLMPVLSGSSPETGNNRETIFYNQMRVRNEVFASRESDFRIGDYIFEVGGKKKGKKQIEGLPNGIVVRDDIETGHGIFVALWQFGFNY